MSTIHEPVMLKEILEFFNPAPGQNFIDCTFGGGGHSLALLSAVKPNGKVLGIDWDNKAVQDSQGNNLILVNDNYRNLKKIYQDAKEKYSLQKIDGILLDLGLSSDQLADEDRGFGFTAEKLDLRFDVSGDRIPADELLSTISEKELAQIFKDYGDEPLANIIARKIVEKRKVGEPIQTASDLAKLVSYVYRHRFKTPSRKHPATRVFQALRIAVNDEFGNIKTVLPQAIELLKVGGRLAVITFHSGEDRIVKNIFKELAGTDSAKIKIITKKPLEPSDEEIKSNPRSRSAKVRVVEKIKL